MVDRLRAEVEETRTEIDQLAYQLLELRSGVPASRRGSPGWAAAWAAALWPRGSAIWAWVAWAAV